MQKIFPYITIACISSFIAILIWLCMPKEYTAITKVSDEYKEMDLAVGLNMIKSQIKSAMNGDNNGLNDIEVYCRLLKTEDFAEAIAHKTIPGRNQTYGEYLGEKDIVKAVMKHINYNYHPKENTLTIGFTDSDAFIAYEMLDCVTLHLQEVITAHRHALATADLNNARERLSEASQRLKLAQATYNTFVDTHPSPASHQIRQQEAMLEKEVKSAYQRYREASDQYVRHKALQQRAYLSFTVIRNNTVPIEDSSHLASYLIPLVLLSLWGFWLYRLFSERREKRIHIDFGGLFSPWALTITVWTAIALMLILWGDDLYPLTNQFYISIGLWLFVFLLSSFLTYNLMEARNTPYPQKGIEINKPFFWFFFSIAIILSPMFLYKVWQIVTMFDTKDMMSNIRTLSISGDSLGKFYYAIVLAPSLLMVGLWRYPKIPGWQLTIIILCCIINALAIMEKGTFFLVVLCSAYVLYERKVIKIKTIGLMFAILFVFFFIFNILRSGEDSEYSQEATVFDFIAMYITSPPVAYCTVSREVTDSFGPNSLSLVYAVLNRFGITSFEISDKLQDFVFVPISTNVYTIMQPFFRDFGYTGVAFFAWLYGVSHGFLYRLSMNGNPFGICFYTYEVQILILQFYQENIFISGMYVLFVMLVIYLCTQQTFTFNLALGKPRIVSQ